MEGVEAEGRTVNEATENALQQLGLRREQVNVERAVDEITLPPGSAPESRRRAGIDLVAFASMSHDRNLLLSIAVPRVAVR